MSPAIVEPEITAGRRAFPMAESLLEDVPLSVAAVNMATGWHDTAISDEQGAFAVVRDGADLDDLIGEVLQITYKTRTIYVYCLGSAGVVADLSLARRAFLSLALLTEEAIGARVAVVQ